MIDQTKAIAKGECRRPLDTPCKPVPGWITSHDGTIEAGSVARRNETQLALRYDQLNVGQSPELIEILAQTISVDQTGSALTGHGL